MTGLTHTASEAPWRQAGGACGATGTQPAQTRHTHVTVCRLPFESPWVGGG
jgi:hypothetical protein